ncbi:MAG: NAD(P)H-hydrate dehydratase, partial [Bryobacteraceae bacterium]|nr:NAD(P)H-hydrate dehydratase [Bryobacteraceae bacterium]
VAVDLPSGMNADSGSTDGEFARADATVTFTAPKPCHVLGPNCDRLGKLRIGQIGSPGSLMSAVKLYLNDPADFVEVLRARDADSNKGRYGHVLVVGGAEGKSGAAEMTGVAALRAGAGLVTVASSVARLNTLELMTEGLPNSVAELERLTERRNVIAIGPGLGTSAAAVAMVREMVVRRSVPMVLDADALNALAGYDEWHAPEAGSRILTPHPGEMARLTGVSVAEVQADRLGVARRYASAHACTVVLKGHRTVVALPDGRAWVNPTGSPSMATGGTGDILTGMIAGLVAQQDSLASVLAAVWLHGRAGEIGAKHLGEQCLLATDLLTYLPEAMSDARNLANRD